jgi:flagellar basal body-associated protein FliL
MKLVMKIGGAVAVVAVLGAGGTFAAMHFLHVGGAKTVAKPVVLPPKPILFAVLSIPAVSISPEAGSPATSFVDFGIQFATTDPAALVSFTALQPIIQSAVINLLLGETSAQLQDPAVRTTLIASSLAVVNNILMKNGYAPPAGASASASASPAPQAPPFSAGYITDLVVQD